jgi:hypothetical protein
MEPYTAWKISRLLSSVARWLSLREHCGHLASIELRTKGSRWSGDLLHEVPEAIVLVPDVPAGWKPSYDGMRFICPIH